MLLKRLWLVFIAGFCFATNATDYQPVDFSVLNQHVNYEQIDDPFWDLEMDVLELLSIVVVYQDKRDANVPVTPGEEQEYEQARSSLKALNVDVDGLLKKRLEIIAQWEAQNMSVNPVIVNKNVEIQGFVLPIEWQGKKLSEFLLVPYVGACIHQPTPPPNQIVFVKIKQPISFPELSTFISVTVQGKLKEEILTTNLTLVDGTEPVGTSYTISADSVKVNEHSNNVGDLF
ncbi:DUF3299 domain-containing protein [Thalassotalea agarivorans]|uniref:DUF3299 domain-containing protein n=1 Tax=Thalassotalea agarivorans TaxID=349064 RepID=A0A1I0BHP3_THASX|nr:DUF3299 domain-containing protein [Thalassotalea agarivorans]SET06069.1 hypothetical protein SAMN05660429_00947 [Thalassotalea agarivorans]